MYDAAEDDSGIMLGTTEHLEEHWYNEAGNVCKSSFYSYGALQCEIHKTFLYDEAGNKISVISQNDDGSLENTTIIKYDESGHILQKLFYGDDSRLGCIDDYQYEDDYSSVKIIRIDKEAPSDQNYIVEKYDKSGELIDRVEHNENLPEDSHTYVYLDRDGFRIVVEEGVCYKRLPDPEKGIEAEFEKYVTKKIYSSDGELVQSVSTSDNGEEIEYQEYDYDVQGRIAHVYYRNKDKMLTSVAEYEYKTNQDGEDSAEHSDSDDEEEDCEIADKSSSSGLKATALLAIFCRSCSMEMILGLDV